MQDEVIALLRDARSVRNLDSTTLASVAEFFRSRVDTLLEDSVRRHPLGFFYASEEVSQKSTLRFHVWPEDSSFADSQTGSEIHDHVYEFNSLIVAGKLRYETFEVLPNERGQYRLLHVTYSSEGSVLHPTGGRVDLEPVSDEVHGPGTIYHLASGVIHRATAIRMPAATVLLTVKDNQLCEPRVVVEHGNEFSQSFTRSLLETQEIAEVRRILSAL